MRIFLFVILQVCTLWALYYAEVIEVDSSNAQYYLSEDNEDNLLIDFYAPWCTHCKKLSPVLDEVAKDSANIVKILKIDATKNKDIASSMNVTKFPTLIYRKQSAFGRYEGPRTYVGLQSLVERLTLPAYHIIHDINDLQNHHFHDLHNITFVLEIPRCGEADEANCPTIIKDIEHSFITVATKLQLKTAFVIYQNKALPTKEEDLASVISLCKYESYLTSTMQGILSTTSTPVTTSQSLYCLPYSTLTDLTVTETVEEFITQNNYPLIGFFENHNFFELAHLNKTMVLLVLDYSVSGNSDEMLTAFRNVAMGVTHSATDKQAESAVNHASKEAKRVAGKVPSALEEALIAHQITPEHYIFGELDGNRWVAFVKYHDTFVPSILIIDHADEEHVSITLPTKLTKEIVFGPDSTDTNAITEQDKIKYYQDTFEMILQDLISEKLIFQRTEKPTLYRKIKYRFEQYYPWSIGICLLPVVLIIGAYFFSPFPQPKKIKKQ